MDAEKFSPLFSLRLSRLCGFVWPRALVAAWPR
jgi:hypothetical protein